MLRAIFVCCVFFGAVSVSSQVPQGDAQPGKMPMMPPPMFGGPGGMHGSTDNPAPMMMDMAELQKLMTEINIDKNVSAKVIAIARTFLKSLDERLIEIQREELNIKAELLKDNPDLRAIQTAVEKKSQVFSKIEYAQIKRDLDIKSLLSRDEYDRWKSAMMQKMHQMMPAFMNKLPPNPAGKDPSAQK